MSQIVFSKVDLAKSDNFPKKISFRKCVLRNFFRINFKKKGSETHYKKLIVISILFKNLFKLQIFYIEKFNTATNRIATEN